MGNRVTWLDPESQEEKKGVVKQVFKNSCKLTLSPSLEVVKANYEDMSLVSLDSHPDSSSTLRVKEENAVVYLNLSEIRIDGGTQQRVACHQQHIFSLVDALTEDAELDPIAVMFDGCDHWLVDGFHRYFAYKSDGREIIPAIVSPGTQREAIFASIAANSEHRALPRTRADKRKAVETLLLDPEWSQWSDRELGKQAKVDHKTVAAIRKCLNDFIDPSVGNSPPTNSKKFVSRHGTVGLMPVRSSEPEPENLPQLLFDHLLKVGDQVIEKNNLMELKNLISSNCNKYSKLSEIPIFSELIGKVTKITPSEKGYFISVLWQTGESTTLPISELELVDFSHLDLGDQSLNLKELNVGDQVVSFYSPNLKGEIVDIESDTGLAQVKWESTGTTGVSRLDDLRKPDPEKPEKVFDLDQHLQDAIIAFVSNLDVMSPQQIRDVFVNSLERLTEEQTKEIFQACVTRLGEFKQKVA
ncbi:ParB/RepB/Spo0J family partition protein [Microcystis aeruginosa]|uniref:ParB/RepB/Spo0J family partition protein n=1 Tax=Microcystis aeruginosa TaxID=1126 RepID=UPI00178CA4DC|nr:ParB/RepB/Spo0J family partition protein [Microcystis aeruginosa]